MGIKYEMGLKVFFSRQHGYIRYMKWNSRFSCEATHMASGRQTRVTMLFPRISCSMDISQQVVNRGQHCAHVQARN